MQAKEEEQRNRKSFNIVIPEELNFVLVSDLELIQRKFLFLLPAKNTVSTILNDYLAHTERGKEPGSETVVRECVAGLKDYFDEFIRKKLLYK